MTSSSPTTPLTPCRRSPGSENRGISAEDSSALLTQARLRTLGVTKFGEEASHMLFTEAGYEQATRAAVANHHAARFVEAGLNSVADLGCGLGADSLAFARAGLAVTSVELDPATAALTAHNLSPYPSAQVLVGNVEDIEPRKTHHRNRRARLCSLAGPGPPRGGGRFNDLPDL